MSSSSSHSSWCPSPPTGCLTLCRSISFWGRFLRCRSSPESLLRFWRRWPRCAGRSWLSTPWSSCRFAWRSSSPHRRTPLACLKHYLLGLEIGFIGDEQGRDLVIGVGLGLIEPLGDVVKGLAIGDIVDEDNSDGSAVVWSSDGFEGLLPCLHNSQKILCPISAAWPTSPRWRWSWTRTQHRWWCHGRTWTFSRGTAAACNFYQHLHREE